MQLITFKSEMQQSVIQFFIKCYTALNWTYDPNGRHADTADIDGCYLQNGCFWCVFDNDLLVGTVGLHTIDSENKIFELKRLFVLPEYQRKGYGNLLLCSAIKYAKDKGYRSICLDTRRELAAAQRLYIKKGFRHIEKYNDNDHADVFFELIIT